MTTLFNERLQYRLKELKLLLAGASIMLSVVLGSALPAMAGETGLQADVDGNGVVDDVEARIEAKKQEEERQKAEVREREEQRQKEIEELNARKAEEQKAREKEVEAARLEAEKKAAEQKAAAEKAQEQREEKAEQILKEAERQAAQREAEVQSLALTPYVETEEKSQAQADEAVSVHKDSGKKAEEDKAAAEAEAALKAQQQAAAEAEAALKAQQQAAAEAQAAALKAQEQAAAEAQAAALKAQQQAAAEAQAAALKAQQAAQTGASGSEFQLLCRIVECEAGSECPEGRAAVAGVIMNRVRSPHFANSITGVIMQPGQFSPVRSGKVNRAVPSASTVAAVQQALAGADYSRGALYFHRGSSFAGKRLVVKVGNHGFFI